MHSCAASPVMLTSIDYSCIASTCLPVGQRVLLSARGAQVVCGGGRRPLQGRDGGVCGLDNERAAAAGQVRDDTAACCVLCVANTLLRACGGKGGFALGRVLCWCSYSDCVCLMSLGGGIEYSTAAEMGLVHSWAVECRTGAPSDAVASFCPPSYVPWLCPRTHGCVARPVCSMDTTAIIVLVVCLCAACWGLLNLQCIVGWLCACCVLSAAGAMTTHWHIKVVSARWSGCSRTQMTASGAKRRGGGQCSSGLVVVGSSGRHR